MNIMAYPTPICQIANVLLDGILKILVAYQRRGIPIRWEEDKLSNLEFYHPLYPTKDFNTINKAIIESKE